MAYHYLSATRGEIVDRNGHGLANNGEIVNFGVVPKALGEGEQKQEKIKKSVKL